MAGKRDKRGKENEKLERINALDLPNSLDLKK